jgi:hypothetical protein
MAFCGIIKRIGVGVERIGLDALIAAVISAINVI